jgi:Fe2+ transport system protein FeoA
MTNLNDLGPGESGVVVGWAGGVPSPRLLEMGILEGTEIEVVRFAPLWDPIEIELRGYHLSIRRSEADQIEIAPCR